MAQDRVSYKMAGNTGYTLLTDSDVSSVTFSVESGAVEILGQNGTSTPASTERGHTFVVHSGEVNKALADIFLGASTPNRMYGRPKLNTGGAEIVISHA